MTTTVPPVRVFTFSCFSQRVCVPPHSFPSLLPPPTSFQINSFPAFAVPLSPSPSILSVHLNTHSLFFLLLLPLCLSVATDQLCQGLFFVFSHPGDEAASKRSRGWCVCLCVWCVCPSFLCPAILALTSVFFFVFCFAFAVDSIKWKKEKTVMTWGAADIRPGSSSRIRGGVFSLKEGTITPFLLFFYLFSDQSAWLACVLQFV